MKRYICFILTAAFLLCGCTSPYERAATENNSRLLVLKIGDSKEMLMQKMGTPKRNEQYSVDGKITEVWYYRTGWTADGKETDDEFTPVIMVDEIVVGWGRSFYDNSIKIKSDITIKQR